MNKRIKKKRELIEQVQETKKAVDIALNIIKSLLDENAKQANELSELRSIVERNAQATNSRFDKIEKQVANSNAKKTWFSRK
ncbi:hypothetical protein QQY84_03665 [Streptococcus suis]|uniref:hypothetical protein n=1 Tax=Streptococcus suis TaxID=1307 RepID=UPI000D0BA96E|nr:hypothetical protein [Streptococcus suis]MBS7854631.1 hypothetical protein [Streptococcus suis]MBS7977690.1 hypothetical protein [Streptococcus suis]MDG3109149.1 hypothetical protein [Streptococcus suis]MDG3147973.1 hypothetical protein [Streptococcus suis]MDG3170293.1 hypothetical protein [Streptococcus suis]